MDPQTSSTQPSSPTPGPVSPWVKRNLDCAQSPFPRSEYEGPRPDDKPITSLAAVACDGCGKPVGCVTPLHDLVIVLCATCNGGVAIR